MDLFQLFEVMLMLTPINTNAIQFEQKKFYSKKEHPNNFERTLLAILKQEPGSRSRSLGATPYGWSSICIFNGAEAAV